MDAHSILPRLLPAAVPPVFSKLASRVLGFDALSRTYAAVQSRDTTRPITHRVLEELEVTYRVAPAEMERIPRTGSTMVVANHPFGILEGVVLGAALLERRQDVRFLANGLLTSAIPELADLIIPVDPMGGKAATAGNPSGMRAAIEHLQAGGLLVVFPAGEVSHFEWRQRRSCDPAWSPTVARMLRLAARGGGAGVTPQVVPLFLDGANSPLFHMAGMIHPRLRTALLARELMNKRRTVVRMRIAKPVTFGKLDAMGSDKERIEYLRWRTYLLDKREEDHPKKPRARSSYAEIAAPGDAECIREEVEALDVGRCLMASAGDLAVYLAPAAAIPHALREIGRLREITFRAVGEGTGRALDIDRFDGHYLHLFVWNKSKAEIAGAYRLAPSGCGPAGLYTNTLFRFGQTFLDRMGPAVELGRSFIRAEYQKGFAPLLLLWKGIGAFIGRNPQYRVLFGPVSISNQYQAVSRELMISFLERSCDGFSDWARFVRPRNAPVRPRLAARACADLDELSDVVNDIETGNAGVPVLLRQYLKLGGKLLGFNVDRDFSNALDGLIVVDLLETEPKLLERYLGREEATAFLAYQRGQNNHHVAYQHQYQNVSHHELGAPRHRYGDSAADAFLQVHRGA